MRFLSTLQDLLRSSMRYLAHALAMLLISMIYYLGIYSERTGFVDQVLDPGLKRITQPVLNAFRGRPPLVPLLRITLSETDMDSLLTLRERVLEEGGLAPEGNTRLPATLMMDDHMLSGILGLAPGRGEQFRDRRWPFIIQLADKDTTLAMRYFALVPVTNLSPLHAWLYQQAMLEQGLPTFGTGLTELRLNERDLGLYAMEGQLDSTALARWGRGPGPVIRFDDGLLTNAAASLVEHRFPIDPPLQSDWLSAPILATRMPTILADPNLAARFQSSAQALDAFRSGRWQPSEVFDVDALARLLAVSDILGAHDALTWWNLRFLADSSSGKLIAMPLRGLAGSPITAPLALRTGATVRFPSASTNLMGRLMGDPLVYQTYIAYLDTFSNDGWLESFLERYAGPFAVKHRIVRSELPQEEYDPQILVHDRDVVRAMLQPRDIALAYHLDRPGRKDRIAIANVHSLPITIHSHIIGNDTVALPNPITLWPRERDRPLSYARPDLLLPEGHSGNVVLIGTILGLDAPRAIKTRLWTSLVAN